jgi:hypothetical protein
MNLKVKGKDEYVKGKETQRWLRLRSRYRATISAATSPSEGWGVLTVHRNPQLVYVSLRQSYYLASLIELR